MANVFTITISAVDKATATVRAVNQGMAKLTAPIARVGAAGKALGREMGFQRLGASLKKVAIEARGVGEGIRRIIAPLAAVTGIGSIAGVVALANAWAHVGTNIRNSAASIGTSTDRLQSLQGAARLAGVSAESLTGGLKGLGDTLEDAVYGRNQDALAMLSRLGINLHRTADGGVDAADAMGQLADAIQRAPNAQVQGLIARTFGVEELLPLLRQGRAGMAAYEAQARSFGAIMSGPQLAAANSFRQSLATLDLAADGLRNSIGDRLIPVLQPLVDKLAAWTAANRDVIATKIGEVAKAIGDAIEQIDWTAVTQGAKDFAASVQSVVDAVGGWKNAAIIVFGAMNAGMIAGVVNLGVVLTSVALAAIPVLVSAVGLLGTAIAATPIGWIIGGIALIGTAAYELITHLDALSAAWNRLLSAKDPNHGFTKDDMKLGDFGGTEPGKGGVVDPSGKGVYKFIQRPAGPRAAATDASPAAAPSVPAPAPSAVEQWQAMQPSAASVSPAASNVIAGPWAPGRQPIGIRQNNPGNIRQWPGAAQNGSGYASFPTAEKGLDALTQNLLAKFDRHGFTTTRQIIGDNQYGWAPAADHNNVPAYLADLQRTTGFGPDDKLDRNNPQTIAALERGIITHENGQQPYSSDTIDAIVASRMGGAAPRTANAAPGFAPPNLGPQGVAQAGGQAAAVTVTVTFENAPAGMQTKVSTKGNVTATARVEHAMSGIAA